jgi:hypothetical protein
MTEYDFIAKSFESENAVLIGSAGLGITNDESDIDICVLRSDLTDEQQSVLYLANRTDYYKDSLLIEHSILYKFGDLDIFVFEDRLKLIVVKAVMDMMNTYPKVFLRIKWIRVKMFRYLLEKHGFLL